MEELPLATLLDRQLEELLEGSSTSHLQVQESWLYSLENIKALTSHFTTGQTVGGVAGTVVGGVAGASAANAAANGISNLISGGSKYFRTFIPILF